MSLSIFSQKMLSVALLITFILKTSAQDNYKLMFVQMIYRHGDRSPKSRYPTDPNPIDVWPLGLGKLTINGRKEHYELGKLLRKMYKNFFTTKPTEVDALSNKMDRCLNSAESNFASFFAPTKRWQFEEGLNWQPIPITSIPFVLDEFIGSPQKCPAYHVALNKELNSTSSVSFNKKHQALYDYLSKHSGLKIKTYLDVKDLYETLEIENKYNMTIPEWVDPVSNELKNVYDHVFPLAYRSPEIFYLRAGPVLGIMKKTFEDKINGTCPELKFRTYSAHDDNIAAILASLENPVDHAIPYCSDLIFELYSTPENGHFIRMRFLDTGNYDKFHQTPRLLTLPGCQEYCPYSRFLEIIKPYAHLDYEHDCEISSQE